MNKIFLFSASAGLIAIASPATAQIAAPVKTMLDQAMAGGNEAEVDTVAKYAKQASPQDSADIDVMVAKWKGDRVSAKKAQLAQAGMLDNWRGTGELGAFLTTGNSKSSGVTVGLKLDREGLNWAHHVYALADFQSSQGKKTRERYLAGGKVDYKFSPRAYAFGLGQWERDPFMSISSRWSAGAGVGYKVIDEPDMVLNLEAGPAYRYTKFTDGHDESSIAGRAALGFGWQIAPNLRASEDAVYYVEANNSSLTSLTALDAKLSDAITGRVSYAIQHESHPLPGREKLDTTGRVSLIYGF